MPYCHKAYTAELTKTGSFNTAQNVLGLKLHFEVQFVHVRTKNDVC